MAKNPHHLNRVRIIAGTHRSRRVVFKGDSTLRPTADRVREQLFNWLGQYLYGQKVLDLFAGSGSLAFEAASRGAAYVVAVEQNAENYAAIRENKKNLGLGEVNAVRSDAFNFLSAGEDKFDVIFLDPPYAWDEWGPLLERAVARMKTHAKIYIESDREIALPSSLRVSKTGRSGLSHYVLAVKDAPNSIAAG